MDFGNTNGSSQQFGPGSPATDTGGKGSGWRIFWGLITGMSVLGNVLLFLMLVGALLLFSVGREKKFTEEVIADGPRTTRIAIVSVEGIIDEQQARDVYWQIRTASEDKTVKGVIVRVDSPGGTLSGSDQIHSEIMKFRKEEKKPVVAFMQGVAASGGYYTSVACDRIIAEPTAITGSIGVIMGYLVLQQLLEEKLGIQPIVVKAGEKKDWPSSFRMPTEEQLQYLQGRIVDPAYKRFVEVVVEGRKELNEEEVRRLADGSIYWANEALKEKLIDDIGYLDDAIKQVKLLAGVEKRRWWSIASPSRWLTFFRQKPRPQSSLTGKPSMNLPSRRCFTSGQGRVS